MLLPFTLASCDRTMVNRNESSDLDTSIPVDASSILDILSSMGSDEQAIASYIVENATEWDNVFKNMFFTNFTMDVYFSVSYEGISVDQHNHIEVSDDAVIYQLGVESHQRDYYFVKSSPDWLAYSYNLESEKYEPVTLEYFGGGSKEPVAEQEEPVAEQEEPAESSEAPVESSEAPAEQKMTMEQVKDNLVREASLYVSFEKYYDQFVFNDEEEEYYCEGVVVCDLDDQTYGDYDIAARKVHVKFFEGNLVSMEAEYTGISSQLTAEEAFAQMEQANAKSTFKITNIGRTVVEEPQNIVKA